MTHCGLNLKNHRKPPLILEKDKNRRILEKDDGVLFFRNNYIEGTWKILRVSHYVEGNGGM
jgi:hypothetical protein